jgi:hypothetical protein
MDERRIGDYFVVAGLPDQPEPLGDFSRDGAHLKATFNQAPITDVTVIFPSLGEDIPPDFHMIDTTPTGKKRMLCCSVKHHILNSCLCSVCSIFWHSLEVRLMEILVTVQLIFVFGSSI